MLARVFPRFLRAAVAFALTCTAALAQTTIHVPDSTHPTIQSGIDAASPGDTVLVASGTYYENIDFKGKAITVTSSDGASKTIIDGSKNKSAAVIMKTNEKRSSILNGFTVQYGGGQVVSYETSGGIVLQNTAPTLTNNVITHNYCFSVFSGGSSPLLQNNEIDNTLDANRSCSFAGGAAIYLSGSLQGTYGQPMLQPTIIGNLIQDNTQSGHEDAGGNGGAGIAAWTSNAIIESNVIRNNVSGGPGAAIHLEGNGGIVIQNLVYGNQSGGGGGALNVNGNNGPIIAYIANNTFANNTYNAAVRDGISNDYPVAQIYFGSDGFVGSSIAFVNNIVAGSSAEPAIQCGWGIPGIQTDSTVFDHNIFYNSGGSIFTPVCTDPTGTYGNLTTDPKFNDPAAFDFHLKSDSPAIDAGNNGVVSYLAANNLTFPTDFDGNPRLQDVTGKNYPVIDIGAYEFTGIQDAKATTILLTPSIYTGTAGTPLTLTARTLSANGTPTGPLTFVQDRTSIGTVNLDGTGGATQGVSTVPGVHHYIATYPGQGVFSPGVSVQAIVVISRYSVGLSLTSSPNSSLVGENVTFTVRLTSPDTNQLGPLTLIDDSNNNLVLATLNPDSTGTATFTINTLALGSHYISVSYAGDSQHNSAGTSIIQQVLSGYATSTTLTSSPNPSITGQNVIFTATVTSSNGTPTGSVQFTDGSTSLGTQPVDASRKATISTSSLTAGPHTITATYIPTGTFAGSSTSIAQTVSAITNTVNVTSSLNPSSYGQAITITAHIASNSGSVSGTVAFYDGTSLGQQAVNASGDATFITSSLTVGAHLITATFTPTGGTTSFSGSYTQKVNGLPSSTLLAVTPSTGVAHTTPITLTATVAPATPGGTVLTGQVIFYVNGAQFATISLVNGVGTYTGTFPAGIDQVYANYVGDPNRVYDSSISNTVSVTITGAPSTLALIPGPNPAPALTPVPITMRLLAGSSPAPAGDIITLILTPTTPGASAGFTTHLTTDATGTAVYNTPGLLPGQYLVTASFAGNADLQPSTAIAFTQTVIPNPTTTTLTASPSPAIQGQPINLTATIVASTGTAAPTGTVAFYDTFPGQPLAILLGSVNLTSSSTTSATAILSTFLSQAGTHLIIADYTPDASFTDSQSTPYSLIVVPQSFTITLSDPTLTVQTEHHRSLTVSLTSIGGLTAGFTLSCGTPLPEWVHCGWGQTVVHLPANGTAATSLTIDTDEVLYFHGALDQAPTKPGASSWTETYAGITLAFLLPLTLFGVKRRRNLRSALRLTLPLLLLAMFAATVTGCGTNMYPHSTTPGTYTIPITATGFAEHSALAVQQTVNLTLVVTR